MMAPHIRASFTAPPDPERFASEMERVPGVRNRFGTWLIAYHALDPAFQAAAEAGVGVTDVRWARPLPERVPIEVIERELRERGEVQSWVLDGFWLPYQRDALCFGWHRGGVPIWHQTGSGKTLTGLLLALSVEGPLILVCRAMARIQMSREITRFTHLRPYILRPASQQKKGSQTLEDYLVAERGASRRPVIILSWEALPDNYEKLGKLAPGSVVFDECFPAGTLVRTPAGEVPIETVRVGDLVICVDTKTGAECVRPVTRTIRKTTRQTLVKVVHDQGEVRCTPNHEFWTEEGYVAAKHLTPHHRLRRVSPALHAEGVSVHPPTKVLQPNVRRTRAQRKNPRANRIASVRVLRDTLHGELIIEQALLRHEVLRKMACSDGSWPRGIEERRTHRRRAHGGAESPVARELFSRDRGRAYAEAQPHVKSRYTTEGVKDTRGDAPHAPCSRGKGARILGCRGSPTGEASRYDCALLCGYSAPGGRDFQHAREELRVGPGRPRTEVLCRDRRLFAQGDPRTSQRRTQGQNPGFSRVVRVEVDERAGPAGSRECGRSGDGGTWVYDLEVAEHHNYFAAGVLVSNCHKGKNPKRYEMIPLPDIPADPEAALLQLRKEQEDMEENGGFVKENEDGRVMMVPVLNIASSAARLARKAKKRILTTATPIKDRLRDLWSQLDICEPNAWGNKTCWTTRYCDRKEGTYGGYDDKGASNVDELAARTQMLAHVVSYEETHRDLPKKRRQSLYISPEDQCESIGGYAAELRKAEKKGEKRLLEVRLQQAASRKRKAVLAAIEDHLYSGHKVVVFTGRRKDCEVLADLVRGLDVVQKRHVPVWMAYGAMSVEKRQDIVSQYMDTTGAAIIIATGQSLGESMNLQDTDAAFFVMLPYDPGTLRQWEGRFCRLNQRRPVVIYYVIAEGTVDERVASILIDKLPAVGNIAQDLELTEAKGALAGIEQTYSSGVTFAQSVLAYVE